VSKQFILQIKVVIYVVSKTRRVFSNCCVYNFFGLLKVLVVSIFVMYLAKPFFRFTAIFVVYLVFINFRRVFSKTLI